MTDRSSISSSEPARGGVPRAALAALLVCLLFELGVFAVRGHLRDGLAEAVRIRHGWLTDPARVDDIAILGDSRAFSLRPDDVRAALGDDLRVTNYTWPFIGIEAYELVLRAYLRAKPAPRAVIVNLMPEYLSLPASHLDMAGDATRRVRAFNVVPAGALIPALAERGEYKMIGDWASYRAMPPSAANRDRLLPMLRGLARGKGLPEMPPHEQRMLEDLHQTGGFLLYADPTATPHDIERFHRLFAPVRLQDNDAILARFEPFLRLARDRGIRVFIVNQPVPEPILAEYETLGLPARYREVVGRWTGEHANLSVLEPALSAYPLELFGDFGHLNRRGDERFRADFREMLAANRRLFE